MRLRSTFMILLIIGAIAGISTWTDRTDVAVANSRSAVPATKTWDAIVEISRHGRRLDGFRPTLTIEGLRGNQSFKGTEVGSGRYRVAVVFPHPGYYTYTVKVADRPAAHGTIYAFPAK